MNQSNINNGKDTRSGVVNTPLPSNASVTLSDDLPNLEWTKQFGTIRYDESSGVSVDSSGNIYVSGNTRGVLPGNTSAGYDDAFIAKYDSAGNQLWAKQFGISDEDYSSGVSVDSSGNIYVVGTSYDIDDDYNTINISGFIVKYNSAGNQLWNQSLLLPEPDMNSFSGVSADSSGNIYVSGNTDIGTEDAFIVKYNTIGNQLWVQQFGSSGYDYSTGVSVDSSGNIYVIGQGGSFTGNSIDAFIVKYDSAGNQLWAKQFGSSGGDYSSGVSVDSFGNIYVSGSTNGSLPGNTNAGYNDAFIVKYDSAGNQLWAKQFGSSSGDSSSGVSVDSSGNVYVTGLTDGSLPGNTSAGERDAFIAKYDSAGNQLWAKQFGSSDVEYSSGVSLDSVGNIYVSGSGYPSDTSIFMADAWLAKFTPAGVNTPTMSINNVNVIEGDTSNPNAVFTVTLGTPSNLRVTVQYTTVPGTAVASLDYSSQSGTLTFNPSEIRKTISIPITDNNLLESDETFTVNLNTPTNATILKADGIATIKDTLSASVTTILPNTIENLTLTGTGSINGTGNANSNLLTGNNGNNSLNGLAGNDTLRGNGGNDNLNGGAGADSMVGGIGNDSYTYDNVGDGVIEAANQGTDTVSSSINYTLPINVEKLILTGTANLNGTGNTLNNTLTGNSGNNILNGGTGADTMAGGIGNDSYTYDNVGDLVIEAANQGTDTVSSSINYTLPINVEKLILTGTANLNGTGNTLNNTLTGNNGNNILNGGTGADTMVGGIGNDSYTYDNVGDRVIEAANQGTDTVNSSINYTLPVNVEKLILTGTAHLNGTGNSLNNTLTGNTGNNILTGASGNDTLIGRSGNDKFVFNNRNEGNDTITDFNPIADIINVKASGFGGGLTAGLLPDTKFVLGSSAIDPNTRFIYNKPTGALWFDYDGTGITAPLQIATLSNYANLSANQIVVI